MKSLASIILLSLATLSFAQKRETFDLATYVIPTGWKKANETNNVVSYAITNNLKGIYCQIGIYASTASKGSLQADFESEWQELIVNTYKPTAKPELVPTASENGWDAQGGVAPFDFSGAQSIAMLVTMSNHDKCMSIVILTNTEDFKADAEEFLDSVEPKKVETTSQPVTVTSTIPETKTPLVSSTAIKNTFAFNTTNFDDGWTSTVQEDWIEVRKGNIKVLIHYPNKSADAYNSVLMDGLKNAWNILVAPRYSTASNFEFKPISGWQSIEFAEADAVENETNKSVHVVLFKMNYSNGSGKYLEFITPDKITYEQEFGVYQQKSYGWEKVEAMANYNKFAVAATDLIGSWTSNYSGMIQYVNASTGLDAGANAHSSNESFEFMADNTYKWNIGVANGMVGNMKFESAKSAGKFSLPSNWQIYFSDLEGKPKTYNAYFSCLKGARLLWLEDSAYTIGYTAYGKKE